VTIDPVFIAGQNPVARLLVSRDRGEHVRDVEGYVRIAERVFADVRATVRGDLMRVPYTHVVLECEKPA
jgi:hypothetical protein